MSLLALLFVSLFAGGQEFKQHNYHTVLNRFSTSDGLSAGSVQFAAAPIRSDFIWPYDTQPEALKQMGLEADYLRHDKDGWVAERWSGLLTHQAYSKNIFFQFRAGFQSLVITDGTSESHSTLAFAYKVAKKWEKSLLSFSGKRGYLLDEVIYILPEQKNSLGSLYQLSYEYYFLQQGTLKYKGQLIDLYDDNNLDSHDLELSWKLMMDPWFKVGLGYYNLRTDGSDANFWSPERFYAWGPRAEFAWSFADKKQFFVGGSYNLLKEKDVEAGQGHYLKTGLQLGDRSAQWFRLAYEQIKSEQSGQRWTSEGFSLELMLDF